MLVQKAERKGRTHAEVDEVTCWLTGYDEAGLAMQLEKEAVIMWFWWFLLLCDSLIPITMIVCGRWMWKHCPKQINGIMGYRTSMSMKNMDTWKFAHEYVGKIWWKFGWILLVPTVLAHIPFYGSDDNTLGFLSIIVVVVQFVFLIGSIIPTERALKRTFYEDGTRR